MHPHVKNNFKVLAVCGLVMLCEVSEPGQHKYGFDFISQPLTSLGLFNEAKTNIEEAINNSDTSPVPSTVSPTNIDLNTETCNDVEPKDETIDSLVVQGLIARQDVNKEDVMALLGEAHCTTDNQDTYSYTNGQVTVTYENDTVKSIESTVKPVTTSI